MEEKLKCRKVKGKGKGKGIQDTRCLQEMRKSRNGMATITKTKHMLCDFRIFLKIKHKEKGYTEELVV